MPNPLAHFEIAGRDGEALESFYSQLFDWSITRRDAGGFPYGDIDTGANPGLTGGIRHEPTGQPEIVLYFKVPDLQAAVDQAQNLGAKLRIPPMETPEIKFAMIEDPEGNPVGLLEGN